MALSNKAVPKYYGRFREAVIRGDIPICKEIEMEMHRIDDLIANPAMYYDPEPVEGWVKFCENELTLTDGSDLHLLDSFKLWGSKYSVGIISKRERYIDRTRQGMAANT